MMKKIKNIRVITLDLDDTIWEIHPVINRAENRLYEWLEKFYPKITRQYQKSDIHDVRSQVMTEFSDYKHDITFLRKMVLSRIAISVGYRPDFIDKAFQIFDEVRNDVDIFPGVIETLEVLGKKFKIIAVTNGNANLATIGIDYLFDNVVTAIKAGAAKPSSKIFEMAIDLGGAKASETLHVGDHPEFDVDGAHKAGLKTVWVNRDKSIWPENYARPGIEISHVSDLINYLD
tara:strand:- start:31 stop:726 length:696 start_codon:yes stop_codon:yes gene_type:complete